MRTVTLYHGTNNANPLNLLDNPALRPSINGVGFYLTMDKEQASGYGRHVLTYELEGDVYDELEAIVRPTNLSYLDGVMTYSECYKEGLEVVLTSQRQLNILVLDSVDAYVQ